MKPRILIIDDEEGIRFTFKTFLSKEGYQVYTAKDYQSGLEILSQTDVDLIVVDIILGERTGIDILREVKRREMVCPVIMVTGQPNIDSAAEAVRLGAFDYLAKPIKKDTLIRATHIALHHKTLLDEKRHVETEKELYRRNLEAIFRSLKDAIVTVNEDLEIIEANDAVRGICGFDPGQVKKSRFIDLPKRCGKSCHRILEETLRTRATISERRIECRHPDRPRQVVLLTCSPLEDRQKRFMGVVLVLRDITRLNDLERELGERHRFHLMIGKSRKMREIYGLLEDLSDTDTTVLITGESGTGKELVATALHYSGLRSSQPFVKVNCSALAENLLESELFGHVKGAFTGAIQDKQGRFEMAHNGSILLDEIGDISPRIQLKLLRVLQEREFERVGDATTIEVDVRVIAVTNSDLREKVRKGEFREDLYYRLKVVEITLPPLRERREDIPLLVEHFSHRFSKRFSKNIEGLSDEVLKAFMNYPWPGNIRELEHAIEHAFVLCRGKTITLDHVPEETKTGKPALGASLDRKHSSKSPLSAEPVLEALRRTDWNKAKAARLLGVSRQTIYRIIEKNELAPSEKDGLDVT